MSSEIKLPASTPSGAYVELGPRPYVLYANIPKSDALVAVLEVWEVPGQVSVYFMRGGIGEGIMTSAEARYAGTAVVELVSIAEKLWPVKMKEGA